MRLTAALIITALLAPICAFAGVLERVAETKILRIGYRVDAQPFSYERVTGEVAGYSVDLCRTVADTLKADLKLDTITIQYLSVTAETRFKAIQANEIDLLCGPTSATLSRRELVDFSLPTFVDGAGLMVRPGLQITKLSDLASKKLSVLAGTTTEKTLKISFPNADITLVTDHQAGIDALKAATTDAYFADRTLLAFLRAKDPDAGALQIADTYLTIEPYALALPKGDTAFRLTVDKTLSRVFQSPRMLAIVKRSFGDAELGSLVNALYRIVPLPN